MVNKKANTGLWQNAYLTLLHVTPHLHSLVKSEVQNHPMWTYFFRHPGLKDGWKRGCRKRRWRRTKKKWSKEGRKGRKVGAVAGEGIPSRFGAPQLKSEHRPQNPARSIYLIFACEWKAPLSGPNCTFNLSGLKERENFSPCLSPHTLFRLNKPISRTLLLQRRLLYTTLR